MASVRVPIGVGVIGVGIRGSHSYEALLVQDGRCRVLAVAQDPHAVPQLLEGRGDDDVRDHAQRLGADYVTDYRDVIRRDDVQLVSLMCHPSRAADLVEEIAAAGKHIVRDKPMCVTSAQADRIVRAVADAGVRMLVTHNVRYHPSLVQARQAVRDGQIGRLLVADFLYPVGNGPLPGFTATPEFRQAFGGGDVHTFGVYAIDYLLWLVQQPVVDVFAQMDAFFYPDYVAAGIEDFGQMTLRFEDGVIGHVLAGRTTTPGDPAARLDLTGTAGSLSVDRLSPSVLVRGDRAGEETFDEPATARMVRDFVDCLLAGQPSPVPPESAARAVRILEAADRSSRTGQPVPGPI